MFITSKPKGFFIEQDENNVRMAVDSSAEATLVVEKIREVPTGDDAAIVAAVRELLGSKPTGPLVPAKCGIYPQRRIVRRAPLDLKKLKEPTYFSELLNTQFHIEADKHTLALLNAPDGSDFDLNQSTQKEGLFCGAPTEDLQNAQDKFIQLGIYPRTLELATVATQGALLNYLSYKQIKSAALMLEIESENTHSFILGPGGVDMARPISFGIQAMIPVVQKQLGLKDEESAKKLFYSNAFDFASMGNKLIARLLKELQSSIGFYEVQTGQSIGHVLCTLLPVNLNWLHGTMASLLGVSRLELDLTSWLQSNQVPLPEPVAPLT